MSLQRIEHNKAAAPQVAAPYPSANPMWASHPPPEFNPWLQAQTPSRRSRHHRIEMDEASETETDDGNSVFSRAIMPPQTPSRRSRSPRKEARERSPVKFGRSPTKLYH